MEHIIGFDEWLTQTPLEDDDNIDHVPICPIHESNYDSESLICECPTIEELMYEEADRRLKEEKEKF